MQSILSIMEKGLEQIVFVLKLYEELKWVKNFWIHFYRDQTSVAECYHHSYISVHASFAFYTLVSLQRIRYVS